MRGQQDFPEKDVARKLLLNEQASDDREGHLRAPEHLRAVQPVPTAPTAAEDGGLSTHVLHMTRLHAKRPLLVELRVINGPFEGGCRLQSGGGA